MSISVLGAGAFGTALAITLSNARTDVTLWARDEVAVKTMQTTRMNAARLPKARFPKTLTVSSDLEAACQAETILLVIPTQKLAAFLHSHATLLDVKTLVACCKGVDLATGLGPVQTIASTIPSAQACILTGPSFAVDIAAGLPTALTLAGPKNCLEPLQEMLSTPALRLYWTTDTVGAELGGALKNVIAIASGAAIGAGFGESARAAVMTRGYAEIQRLAIALGAKPKTLAGLSGFGDLALTCTSARSRNFSFGFALGAKTEFDSGLTVEGAKTAEAVSNLAKKHGIDMPITNAVAAILAQRLTVSQAMEALIARPLKEE
ncbi:NAD(P)H-dependent glycerol-3-phosphate dehydrogenase [Falsihalocynthiibacter arcticus]|uniref:Glycerol-3-phosphate dehydrogenase [NAD(P)+] n=1 Tax=Falsihalocynthiibacter arcticus TaxID=1579316 RepID=A0A126UXP1_9RHOB|nr:NAD(P)H-dependent glycerol-3-phosphate dehydrogenase [Falsihalocynthiibacter arcticus]AML50838.1 glycerol-3-phosphate dehydrogenase [Falsihalocynthiibacter arcticus]